MIISVLLKFLGLSAQNPTLEIDGEIDSSASPFLVRFNNSCLYDKVRVSRDGPKDFDCPRWVIETTDQIWNMYRGKKNNSI